MSEEKKYLREFEDALKRKIEGKERYWGRLRGEIDGLKEALRDVSELLNRPEVKPPVPVNSQKNPPYSPTDDEDEDY